MPFWIQRAFRTIAFKSVARCFHGPPTVESLVHGAETMWFIKVVCTLSVYEAHDWTVFSSDYFRQHLSFDPTIAFFVIRHLCYNFDKPQLAFEFFQFTRLNLSLFHSAYTFNFLLWSICKMGFLDLAESLVQFMNSQGILLDNPVLERLVYCFGNAGKFGLAREILVSQAQLSAEKGMITSPVVHNNLLNMLVKQNRVDDAVKLFQDYILTSRGFCPDTCSFNIVVGGLCRIGKTGKALELFKDMQSQVGIAPDVVTFTSIISGLCKLEQMEEATALLGVMIHHGIRPNLITLNALIDGFGKSGDMGLAMEMKGRMSVLDCCPDVITFTNLIKGHCKSGEIDQGLKLWDEMISKHLSPNAYTFHVVIVALCKENRLHEARDLLRQLLSKTYIVPKAFIFNPVIDGFCKSGNVDEANAIFAEMELKNCPPDRHTFTILIIGHCVKGRMNEAINIFENMSCAPDEITVNSFIPYLLKAGMVNEAYRIKRAASQGIQSGLSSCKRPELVKDKMDIRVAV